MRLQTWRQEETSSLRLLSVHNSGLRIIKYFSNKHKLQRLFAGLYGFALARIFHEIVCSMFLSFNDQICLLSSVEFLLPALRNDEV